VSRLQAGGLVDRDRSLGFTFDGRSYAGFAGDTLASALVANDVKLLGRSFKYHRPRGLLAAGSEEPNALVELRTGARREPNTRATTVELFDGLAASSQNRWPSLAFDLLSLNQLLSPLFVAGFYYKTFMWPASFWEKVYEPLIRRASGLGRASGLPDPDAYEKAFAFCDVLVIGAGPAGLMAARTAARAGARVILCEDDFRLGGRLLAERDEVDGQPGAEFARSVEDELAGMPDVRIFRRTQVFGVYDGGTYGALERVADHLPTPPPGLPRQRLWHFVTKRCINAMGAIERPIAFSDNDRPGIMLASAVRTYLNRFAAVPARRTVVFTTSDDGWRTACDLSAAGTEVAAIVDARPEIAASLTTPLARLGVRSFLAARVMKAHGGPRGLRAVEIVQEGATFRVETDGLAVSGGWNPQVALTTHKGGRPRWSPELSAFVPSSMPEGMSVAGAVSGDYGLFACLRAGCAAGAAAADDCGFAAAAPQVPRAQDEAVAITPLWHVAGGRGKSFVDPQNDVTVADIEIAWREGFCAVEHLKRYTTLGMATDQGKTGNVVGHAIMAGLTGRSMEEVGISVMRPPHLPVAIGAFAGRHRGRHFKPTRYLAGHDWALQRGATMVDAGQWLRPQWFSAPGETDWLASAIREVTTTRSVVGVCDVSTLGKIDIKGKDAGIFLDRIYINRFSTLSIGKTRYGVMLREDGFVMDDGTAARLGASHYVVSTTTANAAKVMQHLEFYHQVAWPELDVAIVSVTEHWAQYAVAGPRSREVVQAVYGTAADISNSAFPYLACRDIALGEIPTRLFRLSFSGELAYEIAVPARYGESLLDELVCEAVARGGCAYGTEALGVMRVEKGHIAGNELNGQTVAGDLGLAAMASTEKDYVGRIMAGRPALTAADRPRLVGVRPADPAQRLRAGAHVLALGAAPTADHDEGYVTSVVYSPTVESWIGLALVRGGTTRLGTRMRAFDPVRNGDVEIEIVSPIAVDPKGERLHG
jgi:heterotetrameric sarcosine oxidase alpha subunit